MDPSSIEEQEVVKEFLIESTENLARLDQEMVELEKRPGDAQLLASIFRTIHTIKGTCGFLGFTTLEGITHHAENLLSQIRNGERPLEPHLVSLILETVDATKRELVSIEQTMKESGEEYLDLRERLRFACESTPGEVAPPKAEVKEEAIPAPSPAIAQQPPAPVAAATPPPILSAEPPAEADTAVVQKGPSVADSTIRVDVGLLDRLMNLVGELVLARNQILQFTARQEDAQLNATSQRLNLITTQLQEGVMKTRMQPIGMVWNKLPRVVRDLAAACGKQIQLEMDGADTELDKSIIEAIKDPLTHIVRNCCDHGIERPDARMRTGKPGQGKLALRAFHEGGQVNIEIVDDGAGIDPAKVKRKALEKGLIRPEQAERMSEREAVQLVFLPGFSTAEQVTNISGRGVGMDVVKTNIEKIGGTVDLSSKQGQGTTVKIKIPLTLAIIPGLVVTSGGERFVIPQVSLLELLRLEPGSGQPMIERIHGAPVYRRRGALLPIAYLNEVLGMDTAGNPADAVNIVVLQAEDRQFGLVVDGISDTQEIVVKPLGKQLKGLSCYAGATIMGDGKVALILDVLGIGLRSGVLNEFHMHAQSAGATDQNQLQRQTLLLFRAGAFGRLAVPLSLVARLEEFPAAKIERAGGRSVVQYRDQILPLVSLGDGLSGVGGTADGRDPAQVIVFSNGERRVGLLVDEIVDIIEDEVAVRKQAIQPGLLGSAVVGGKVTDFIDLPRVVESAGEDVFSPRKSSGRLRVLVADPSAFGRSMVRTYVEMAGHSVIEASTATELVDRAGHGTVHAVLASADLPVGEIRARLGAGANTARLPLIVLGSDQTDAAMLQGSEGSPVFDDFQLKYDRDAMLRSLERLAAAVSHPVAVHAA